MVSPGFTPRPSLSEPAHRRAGHRPRVSPGFTARPSLSGLQRRPRGRRPPRRVSPGFTPRPSLSGPAARGRAWSWRRVAGVHAPAFVERSGRGLHPPPGQVSPGFTPRPSLSALRMRTRPCWNPRVSPGFTPRPSLSGGGHPRRPDHHRGRVAGVHAPAFVERTTRVSTPPAPSCVAGVHAPAFVERVGAPRWPRPACRVSPGFTPRPSLSVQAVRLEPPRLLVVSPGFTPRPSLSGLVPDEHVVGQGGCRRGSRPGLR